MAELKVLYELFILGRLMSQPFHGYLLRRLLDTAIGPTRQMSWGVLYPLIRRLEEDGLIASVASHEALVPPAPEGERQRRVYQITAAGKARFDALMRDPGEYNADYADIFSIKLSSFAYIPYAEQLDILRHYRGYVQFVQRHVLATRQRVATLPAIRDFERRHYLRMLNHKLQVLAADLAWVEQEIGRDDSGTTMPQEG